MPSFRHLSRQLVFQALFAENYQPNQELGFLEYVLENFGANLPEVDFAKQLHQSVKESQEKLLVKSEDEYTSPISKIYKVGTEYIIMTENSIYLVDVEIPTKRISS